MWVLMCFLISGGLCIDVEVFDNVINVKKADNSSESLNAERKNYNSSERVLLGNDALVNVVITDHGAVRGYVDDEILQFFDIPYGEFSAERPFQVPIEPSEWEGIREIDAHRSRCPQINEDNKYVGGRNCLTLSVFKPFTSGNVREGGSETKADVLFHIHDSFFSSGSGDPLVYGPKYLVPSGIILVLPNYRLGPLGFLCLQNETAPGNAALKDLTLALNWTRRNIETFGGNSSNIVISGSGAGGALVEYLLLSNVSRMYISGAITESGFSLSPWAIDRTPLNTASVLLQNIASDINTGDQQIAFNVLDQIDLELLIRSSVNITFRPCVEVGSGFITETPWRLMHDENFQFAYMCGLANRAASVKAIQHTQTEESLYQLNNNLSLLLPSDLTFESDEDEIRVSRRVKTLYFGNRNITINDVDQLTQCFTDSQYLNSGLRGARLMVKGGATVYFYEYSLNNPNLEISVNGSTRGDSLVSVFSRDGQTNEGAGDTLASVFSRDGQTNEGAETVRRMTNLWVSFIKTGQPSAANIVWNNLRDVTEAEEKWLSINDEMRMERGVHLDRLGIWRDIYENHFIYRSLGSMSKPSVYRLLSFLVLLRILGDLFKSPPT